MDELKNLPAMLKVEELAKTLRIGRNPAYDLCKDPNFYPAFRVGKSIRISKKLLLQWLQENNQAV